MSWRRLLYCLLIALTFDAVVPFEPTAAGKLQLDDELEEAAQLRARRDHRRDAHAAQRRSPTPVRVTAAPRVEAPMPHGVRPRRFEVPVRPLHAAAEQAAG